MLFLLQSQKEVTPEPVLVVQFAYRCSEGGGWHDFFAYQDHLVPWSPAKERAGGEPCIRLNFRGVDDVLHVNLHAGWEAYNAAGVSQVKNLSTRKTLVCSLASQWCAMQSVPAQCS